MLCLFFSPKSKASSFKYTWKIQKIIRKKINYFIIQSWSQWISFSYITTIFTISTAYNIYFSLSWVHWGLSTQQALARPGFRLSWVRFATPACVSSFSSDQQLRGDIFFSWKITRMQKGEQKNVIPLGLFMKLAYCYLHPHSIGHSKSSGQAQHQWDRELATSCPL